MKESKVESEIQLTDAPEREKYFNENHKLFKNGKWLYDTPGIIQPEQIINSLTSEELLLTIPKDVLLPRVFYVQPGQTLFVSGIGRVDYVSGSLRIRLAVFASKNLTTLLVNTEKANEIYEECLGSEILNVPRGDANRLKEWPGLMRCDDQISVSNYYESDKTSVCGKSAFLISLIDAIMTKYHIIFFIFTDIILSSTGWVSVNLPITETANFYAWTPNGQGIFIRKPSLLPYAASVYRGARKKFTPTYNHREPTILER